MISMANGTTKYHLNCKCYLLTTPKAAGAAALTNKEVR
jgi:hypothetical protein